MRTACPAPCRCHARNRQDTAQQECRLTTARDEGKNVFSFRGSDHCSALQSMVVRSEGLTQMLLIASYRRFTPLETLI